MENKGESDHFLEILENLEILEILEVPPGGGAPFVMTLFPVPTSSRDVRDFYWLGCPLLDFPGETSTCDFEPFWSFKVCVGSFESFVLVILSGLKKTRPFRFLLLNVYVWTGSSSVLAFFGGRSPRNLAVDARNRAKTTKIKSDLLETPVILMADFRCQVMEAFFVPRFVAGP